MLNYKIKDESINTSQLLVERINLPLNCEEKYNFFIVILRSTKEKVSKKNSKQFLYLDKRKKTEEEKRGSHVAIQRLY